MHIEFIGLPGSGKTTLSNLTNRFLERKLNYNPASSKLRKKAILEFFRRKQKLSYIPAYLLDLVTGRRLLNRFAAEELIASFLAKNGEMVAELARMRLFNNTSQIRFFLNLVADYELINGFCKQPIVSVFDQGFFHTLFALLSRTSIQDSIEVEQIITTFPRIDLLFVIETSVRVCIERMKKRPEGFAGDGGNMHPDQLFTNLSRVMDVEHRLVSAIDPQQTSVFYIENESDMTAAFQKLLPILDCITEEEESVKLKGWSD